MRYFGTGFLRISKKFVPKPFEYHQELTVTIHDLSNSGAGIARHALADGSLWVVFVPLTIPGEVCRVRVHKNHLSYSEADLGEHVSSSLLITQYVDLLHMYS